MTASEAYEFAFKNPNCDIGKYQEISCESPDWGFLFAENIPRANISYCQKHACKDPKFAYWFAANIRESDIERCYCSGNNLAKQDIKYFILNQL